MARIRSLKPELTLDEDLAALGFAARYFFINLWCHCDREGRLEDRPKKLQVLILPWDNDVNAETLLNELSPKFVTRYEVAGKRYIQVNQFAKHQRPHPTEAKSEIPSPDKHNSTKTVKETAKHVVSNEEQAGKGEGKGEGKGIVATPKTESRRTPVSDIIEIYKFLKRIGYIEVTEPATDNADQPLTSWKKIEQVHFAWNQANYKIYARSAKKLLDAFGGDLAAAKVYMTTRADEWIEKGLDSWELHGMARDAHNFVAKEITKDAEADGGRALALREGVGGGSAGTVGFTGDGGSDRGAGSRRRFTSARELAGRALEGLQPKDD